MVRSEYRTDVLGRCPCGKGHVVSEVETTDSMYSRARFTNSIACADCSLVYIFRGASIDHQGWFSLRSEEAQSKELGHAAVELSVPIQSRLTTQAKQAIRKAGNTAAHWLPIASKLFGDVGSLEDFRKELKSDGGLDSWITRRVLPDRYLQLANTLGESELLPLVHQYLEARERHRAFRVQSIAMVPAT